jgi:hypothetical protein
VRLQLDRASDPISGSLVFPDGRELAFSGWIDLTAALERVRNKESPGDPKKSRSERQ